MVRSAKNFLRKEFMKENNNIKTILYTVIVLGLFWGLIALFNGRYITAGEKVFDTWKRVYILTTDSHIDPEDLKAL